MRLLIFLPLIGLSTCESDETVAAYGAAGPTWQLQSLDNTSFSADASLQFEDGGKISGKGPCNSFSAAQTAPYPWFEVSDLVATSASCPSLEAEGAYFAALMAMTQSEVSGNVLILRNDAGHEMLFKAGE
ncbi:META domain-containing protein [Primorskyibacter sp. S87]|uniref:META domain-containing protein n=1 Tax=Primorskyibacter sp. S87 TaxID=3415126 RepID=UPI003C7E7D36